MTSTTTAEKRRRFRQLHASGCFVIPNPWDAGSARWLQALQFQALATTSSGCAWSHGHSDNRLPRSAVLSHLAEIVAATDLPVNADFENGFGSTASEVEESVALAVATGIAGLSIEDAGSDAPAQLFAIDTACERVAAARRAIDAAGGDTLLVARSECFLLGLPDRAETIARLQSYAAAGADCLYAPGLRSADDIGAIVAAVAPRPVNVLIGWASELTVADLAALGVRRISVGGAMARAAWGGFMRAARTLADSGRFDGFADAAHGDELNAFFDARPMKRAPP